MLDIGFLVGALYNSGGEKNSECVDIVIETI